MMFSRVLGKVVTVFGRHDTESTQLQQVVDLLETGSVEFLFIFT